MAKKKRQGEPDNSSESSDEFKNTDCSHVKKSVDLGALKKVTYTSLPFECKQCNDIGCSIKPEEELDIEYEKSIWMCLRCGNPACGRYAHKHAFLHYKTPHSDPHNICLNTSTWEVWCYECQNDVNPEGSRKLSDCIAFIRKQIENNSKTKLVEKKFKICSESEDDTQILSLNPILTITKDVSLPGVRGLTNLGNTCFFNSVMQCLGQTPYLLELLEESAKENDKGKLPGGKLCLNEKEKKFVHLDPIEIEASSTGYGPLTLNFAKILKELQSEKFNVIDPHSLFQQFKLKRPQFRGHDQQDSHELLRHLLEAVREECLSRYNKSIKDHLNPATSALSDKLPKKYLENDSFVQKMVNFYESQASEILLPTEWVFRGVLVSTLQCQDCEHTSKREEFFLDLSLPISEKKTAPLILRRKAEDVEIPKPSKHQLKKEKRQAAKQNKRSKANNITSNLETVSNNLASAAAKDETSSPYFEGFLSDTEDNEDSCNVPTPEEGPSKGTESGYNSDKNKSPDDGSPDMCVDDSGVPSPVVGMLSNSPIPGSPGNSSESSEINLYLGSPICGRGSPNPDSNEEYERPESRLSFVNNKSSDLKADLEKLSLKNDNKVNDEDMEGACGGFINNDMEEKMDIDNDFWGETITARYNIEEGECSVQSCLNQFTSSELLTSNNKVSCDECTKRHGGTDKKIVYTNAQKQLLICNPPAVLILHLKRFQVSSFRLAKMGRHVKFPTVLDIAPFCSKRSKNISTSKEAETKVLYSLYGVVEHSGSMHGGHYVAYVKVRPKLSQDNYRWSFLPQNKNHSSAKISELADIIPDGKWYYISDSHTSEVKEHKVLNSNAYLLFYERIL